MDIISFDEAKNSLLKAAYDWAVKEQERMNIMAQPITLTFESDNLTVDSKDCVVSVFYDQETKEAILRRDWLDDMTISYLVLVNWEDVKKTAPDSAARMLDNGIKLYRFYDGPTGGITRKMRKEWG